MKSAGNSIIYYTSNKCRAAAAEVGKKNCIKLNTREMNGKNKRKMCIARIYSKGVVFLHVTHLFAYLFNFFLAAAAAGAHIFRWAVVIVVIKAQRPNRRPNESSFVMDNSENILTHMMHTSCISCAFYCTPHGLFLLLSFFLLYLK